MTPKQNARFYRETIALARLGDPASIKIVRDRGWNSFARVGTVKTRLGVVTNRDKGVAPKHGAAPTPKPAAPQKHHHRASPRSKPAAPPPPPAPAPRVAKRRKIARPFSDFLASNCKSLKLAAKVLGVTPRPPLVKSKIRDAWISLISVHHPDKGGALEAAQAVNAAYQLLKRFSQ
jgi:hypothetical protein